MKIIIHGWEDTLKERIAPFGFNSVLQLYEWVCNNELQNKRYVTLYRIVKDEHGLFVRNEILNISVNMIMRAALKEVYPHVPTFSNQKKL